MVETITLSIPAVDILGERMNLPVRQYPFELPRVGESPEHRSRLEQQVWQELEMAGLARGGSVEPEVEDALYLLCSPEVSIAAAGLLDVRSGQRLAARVVATGEVGVLGQLGGRGLQINFLPPDELPAAAVGLLPEAPVGRGEVVRAVADRSHGHPADADIQGLPELRAFTARQKIRLGHFVVTSTRTRQHRIRLPNLIWFDTDLGRYSMRGERIDHQDVIEFGPADGALLREQLAGLVDRAHS